MTSWFTFMVWLGGVRAMPDRKRGFANRLTWPYDLGRALYVWAYRMVEEDGGK